MNWFTWAVIAIGAVLAACVLIELVRPRRAEFNEDARLRERDMGDAEYRGGHRGRPWDENVLGP